MWMFRYQRIILWQIYKGLLLLEFDSKIKLGEQLKTSEQSKTLGDLWLEL